GESKRKVQIHLTLVTFIIHVHCVYQLLPSKMKDIPLPSALLLTVVKLWEVLCAVSQITCQQMTSFLCWHTDFEDLYSILSNESPPQNASNQFHQKAKQWVQLFLSIKEEGHQKKYVTPYMHAMVYHVPNIIRQYRNLNVKVGNALYFFLYALQVLRNTTMTLKETTSLAIDGIHQLTL
ncbi:hypothetical protein EMCRGX_G001322, partial [Ephydatia muelleri]